MHELELVPHNAVRFCGLSPLDLLVTIATDPLCLQPSAHSSESKQMQDARLQSDRNTLVPHVDLHRGSQILVQRKKMEVIAVISRMATRAISTPQ